MKILLYFCLLLFTISARAQSVPFKGASTIHIHTLDSAAVAYRKFAGILLAAGYGLKNSDKELLALTTEPRAMAKMPGVLLQLRTAATPGKAGADIQLRGAFSISGIAGESEAVFRGMNGSPFMTCWAEMQRLAALYPGAALYYTKD